MASPVPYSRPKRRLTNKKSLVFKTSKGSYVYAPADGKLVFAKNGVIVRTHSGIQHRLYGVTKGTKAKNVVAGQRIGFATGSKVVYYRYHKSEILDAMPPVKRDDGPSPKEVMPGVKFVGSNGEPGIMGPGMKRKLCGTLANQEMTRMQFLVLLVGSSSNNQNIILFGTLIPDNSCS